MTNPTVLDSLSGYSDTRDLLATRYKTAVSTVYVIAIPLHLIPSHLPKPDANEPFEGNRRVDPAHARKFARYWRDNERWTTPPILLDTNAELAFEVKFSAAGVDVGILSLPHNSAGTLDILDGQHRVLGWYLVRDDIASELKKAREQLQRSKQIEDETGVQVWKAKIADLEAIEKRLKNEYVTMELLAGVTLQDHKQAFADITNNAKGITKSKTVEFDSVSVINRVTRVVSEHKLLADRVDFELDRVTGKNPNFLSARNVADIVRHVALGIKGRMNDRREQAFTDQRLEKLTARYLDCLMEAFPQLQDLADGSESVDNLRKASLLASPTILRVMAGVFHNLAVDLVEDLPELDPKGYDGALIFFQKLAAHMTAPIARKSSWHTTGYIEEGGMAPGSRSQDLSELTDDMTDWATGDQPFPF